MNIHADYSTEYTLACIDPSYDSASWNTELNPFAFDVGKVDLSSPFMHPYVNYWYIVHSSVDSLADLEPHQWIVVIKIACSLCTVTVGFSAKMGSSVSIPVTLLPVHFHPWEDSDGIIWTPITIARGTIACMKEYVMKIGERE